MNVQQDMKLGRGDTKPPLHWIPMWALQGVSRVFAYGARKYAPGNWLRAAQEHDLSRAAQDYTSAALRHWGEIQAAEPDAGHLGRHAIGYGDWTRPDPESGLPHLDHLICSLIMLRGILQRANLLSADPGRGNDPPKSAPLVLPSETDDAQTVEQRVQALRAAVQPGNHPAVRLAVEKAREQDYAERKRAALVEINRPHQIVVAQHHAETCARPAGHPGACTQVALLEGDEQKASDEAAYAARLTQERERAQMAREMEGIRADRPKCSASGCARPAGHPGKCSPGGIAFGDPT